MAKITTALVKELIGKVTAGEISFSRMAEILNEQVRLNPDSTFEYYKVVPEFLQYKGDRYFKFNWNSTGNITQVCLETNGETKRGKGHYIGIYQVTKTTFFSNWYPRYVIPCTEEEFEEAFKKAEELLKKK